MYLYRIEKESYFNWSIIARINKLNKNKLSTTNEMVRSHKKTADKIPQWFKIKTCGWSISCKDFVVVKKWRDNKQYIG